MDYSFGTWIKRRRKALDLTQHELAQRVGCSVSLIFKIESDERRPSRQIAGLLARHLEIPPEERELFLQVARQEKASERLEALSTPSAAVPVPSTSRPSLPVPLTDMIGREHELSMIARQLEDPACRLLSLTGPGGVGKTRLALEVAHRLRDRFADGACFVSLAGTGTPDLIVPAVAEALGLTFAGGGDLNTQLLHFLRDKRILIVLDNLEHLVEGIDLLDQLLRSAPGVALLTTTREALNLRAEWVFEVQGLPVPTLRDPENLESNSAVALFLRRARQVRMSFQPDEDDLAAIVRICQVVEGLPLGIELAATWVTTLTCPEIAAEIERNLGFLSSSRRDLPERHRSLQAVFDYSWNLLSADEQALLMSLSVFHGGFQRAAAAQVARATLPLLSSLTAKSFVRRGESGRYTQHELVRQYAGARLDAGSRRAEAVRDRHAQYFLALWHDREQELKGPRQQAVLGALVSEIDNFRAAWDWAVTRSQFKLVGSCLRSLLLVYDLRGWYAEGNERVESMVHRLLLSAADLENQYPDLLALASALRGWFHFRRGQLDSARACFEHGLGILPSVSDPVIVAEVLSMFGPVLTSLGEAERALEQVSAGLSAARASGDRWHIAYALMMQGGIQAGVGRNDSAYESAKEALGYFRALGDLRQIVVTLNTLGFVCMQLSRLSEAREFLQESLNLVTAAVDPWSAGTALGNLGLVELAQGNPHAAEKLLQKSIALFQDLGMTGDVGFYLTYHGEALARLGNHDEAEEHWLDAIRLAAQAQAMPTALGAIIRLAELHSQTGQITRAYDWAQRVAEHPGSWQESKLRARKLVDDLRGKNVAQKPEAQSPEAQRHFSDLLIQQILAI